VFESEKLCVSMSACMSKRGREIKSKREREGEKATLSKAKLSVCLYVPICCMCEK